MSNAPCRILLLEDNEDHAELFLAYLGLTSYANAAVTRAEKLGEALRLIAVERFDLVFADLSLTDSGIAETMRALPELSSHAPVVVLTSLDDRKTILEIIDHGADDCLPKSRMDELMLERAIRFNLDRWKYKQIALGEERRKYSEMLVEAERVAGLGCWELDLPTGSLSWSKELRAILELEGAEPSDREWLAKIHPDDREAVAATRRRFIEAGEPCVLSYRLICSGGRVKHVTEQCSAHTGREGGPLRLVGMVMDITERKQAESRLIQSEARLRLFIEHAPAAIAMFDREMRYLEASARWVADHGLVGQDVLGLSHYEVFPEISERWKAIHRRALAGEAQRADGDRFERLDGAVQWLSWEILPWWLESGEVGGILIFAEDITGRKRVEQELERHRSHLETLVAERTEALRASERRFRTLFETSNDAILILREGRFIDCNDRASQLFGCDRTELTGNTPFRFSPAKQLDGQDSHLKAWSLIDAAWKGRSQCFEWRHAKADGSVFDAEVSLNAFDLDGETLLQAIVRDISERKRMEAQLRESELRWKFALEGSGQGVWDWDIRSGRVYFSPRWKSMIGYRDEEFPNRFEAWESHLYPEDKSRTIDALDAYFQGGLDEYAVEFRMRCKDGGYRWIQAKGIVVEYGESGQPSRMIGVHTDIEDRKRAESTLRESEARFRVMANTAPVLIWIAGPDKLCHWFNQVWLDFTGRALEQERGNGWAEGVHPDDFDRCLEVYTTHFDRREPFIMEYRLRRRDGEYRWINNHGVPLIGERGEFAGYIGSCIDITEIAEARQELERLNLELERRTRQAEAANQAKSDFLANMSHELRSPMNCILGMAGLVLDTDLTPSQRDYLNKVHTSSKALLRLLNDILDYSKIEAGHLDIEQRPFELADTVRNVADLFAIRVEQKGLQWHAGIDPAVPRCLVGDDFRLSQVLINLVGNALKFTERGMIGLDIGVKESTDTATKLRFTVRDTGIGMTPEQVGKLFASFSQADTSTTRKYGGTGLGLAISKRLVELMGGRIEVQTEYGMGSTFVFTAEFRRASDGAASAEAAVPLSALALRAKPVQGARILVVDDQDANLALMESLLNKLGLRAVCVENGPAALARIMESRFDAVLMDLQMPGMDGFEATKRIIGQCGGKAPPIIALTAAAMTQHRQASLDAGMVEHLAKPIDPAMLVDALLKHIRPNPAAEAPLRALEGHERERLGDLLPKLERRLSSSDFQARRIASEIEALLMGTELAASFAPVMEAVRKLSFKNALHALTEFRGHVPMPEHS